MRQGSLSYKRGKFPGAHEGKPIHTYRLYCDQRITTISNILALGPELVHQPAHMPQHLQEFSLKDKAKTGARVLWEWAETRHWVSVTGSNMMKCEAEPPRDLPEVGDLINELKSLAR